MESDMKYSSDIKKSVSVVSARIKERMTLGDL